MTLKLGLVSLSVAVVAACTLFAIKDKVRRLEGQLHQLQEAVSDERAAIHRLETEWAILNRPDRIARLAEAYVGLQPAKPGQIARIDDIPLRSELQLDSRALQVVLPSGEAASLRLKPRGGLLRHPGLGGKSGPSRETP